MPTKKTDYEIQANRIDQVMTAITSKQKKYTLSELRVMKENLKKLTKLVDLRLHETEDKVMLMRVKNFEASGGDMTELEQFLRGGKHSIHHQKSVPSPEIQEQKEEQFEEEEGVSFARNSTSSTQPTPFGER
ncbi:hypothetical protein [Enterococcus diestrammenae]|uniref:Uncharacterized protein n=2 Tax=Enterococcus diestrammenae TaxID=1155073 RepID=A0ABV0F862_9ENTE